LLYQKAIILKATKKAVVIQPMVIAKRIKSVIISNFYKFTNAKTMQNKMDVAI